MSSGELLNQQDNGAVWRSVQVRGYQCHVSGLVGSAHYVLSMWTMLRTKLLGETVTIPALGLLFGLLASDVAVAFPIMSGAPNAETHQPSRRETAPATGYETTASDYPNEAIKHFREAVQADPQSLAAWLGLAEAARQLNRQDEAEMALEKAVQLAPGRPEPIIAKARWKLAEKAYGPAETLLRRAAEVDPKSPLPWIHLGDLYAEVHRNPEKAAEFYRDAIRVAPKHAGAHYAFGSLLLARRDVLGAIQELQVSQELAQSQSAAPSLLLGHAYSEAKRWRDARDAYSRTLQIDPRRTDAYLGRAATYVESGNIAMASADLTKAEEVDPTNPDVSFRVGLLRQEQRDYKGAFTAYERTIKIAPNYLLAYNNLAWLAASRGERLDEAMVWIHQARALAPKNPNLCDTHGWVLRAKGDLDGAIAVLNEGIGIQPTADLHYHLGVIQMEKGRPDEARTNLRKALQIRPDFGDALDAKRRLKDLDASAAAPAK